MGWAVLCSGSTDDKVKASFVILDQNGDGVVSRSELNLYFFCVFKIVEALEPETLPIGFDTVTLANQTAREVFDEFDADRNGVLSFDEFKAWYEGRDDASSEPPAHTQPPAVAGALVAELRERSSVCLHQKTPLLCAPLACCTF